MRLEIRAPISDEDLRRRFGEWAAALRLAPGASLVLERGKDAAHRVINVVSEPPPLPDSLTLPVLADFSDGLVLGQREDGRTWRWLPRDAPHMLVSGATGSGKTQLARRIAVSWLEAGGRAALLDYGKGTAFIGISDQYAVPRAVSKADCEVLLRQVRQEMEYRYQLLQIDKEAKFVRHLVVFEEPFAAMSPLSGRDDNAREDQRLSALLADYVVQIAMLGRECGVHLLMVPQRGDASALGSGAARDQLGMRVLMLRGAMDATVDMALEMSRSGLIPGREPPAAIRDLAAPPGRALVRGPDGYQLVQVAL